MKLLRGFDSGDDYRGGFLSIGNFDGVHRGHQQMFASLVRNARERAVPAVVLTFDPHPIRLLRPNECPPALTSLDQKAEFMEACGVDCLVVYQTDLRLLNLSATEFFQTIVEGVFEACGMVEGPNFYFGRDRAGTVETLEQLCRESTVTLDVVPPVYVGTQMVSSSAIRQLLLDGELGEANDLLGHHYRIRGNVSRGSARGSSIGYPTANITHVVSVMPQNGVYAGIAHHNGCAWPAAVNLGPNPTFGESRRKLEAHLIGFDGDLYDETVDIEFVARIRDTLPFPDVAALKEQLARDVQQVRAVVRA